MAVSQKCEFCGTTVYHAEEQHYDGKLLHIQCMGKYKLKTQEEDLRGRNIMYQKEADVSPEYYRTSDTGTDARMESGKEYKESAKAGPSNVCEKCNASVKTTQSFCGNCGSKLGVV